MRVSEIAKEERVELEGKRTKRWGKSALKGKANRKGAAKGAEKEHEGSGGKEPRFKECVALGVKCCREFEKPWN